jgi:hypothetical protein
LVARNKTPFENKRENEPDPEILEMLKALGYIR